MADPVAEPIAAPAAPAPAAPAAPVAAAVVTPAASEAPAPAPVATPAAEPTSILSDAKAEPISPAPASVDTAAQAAPAQPSPEPAPLPKPTYESFKLPDGITLDQAGATKFTDALAAFETDNKADHAKMQALGQSMVDMFTAEMQAFGQRQQQAQLDAFNQAREGWRNEIKADASFGGDNFKKTVADAGAFIEQYGGTADEIAAARLALRITGAGDHPALIKLFARAGKALAREGAPVPATTPKAPITMTRTQRRYGNSLTNGSGA